MQPVFASSAYTVPFWLPTNRRPPATVGCDHAEVASGKPNDHFSFSFGTLWSVRPACAAVWKRVLSLVGDHPPQPGEPAGIENAGVLVQRPNCAPVTSPPRGRPVRYSAPARRSAPVSRPPCGRMPPAVSAERIASGERRRSTSGDGARVSGAPVWHCAHSFWKTAAPLGAWAKSGELAASASPRVTAKVRVVARMWGRLRAPGFRLPAASAAGLKPTPPEAQRPKPEAVNRARW